MCVPSFMAIHPIAVETFHLKPQSSASWWHWSKSQGIAIVMRIHPLGTMNICARFCANPSTVVDVEIFHRISENFNLLVALEEKSEDNQSP